MKNNKIIVILGPTASGKSSTAISLAKKFNGEIISADSRQIYRGMDVGTGKEPGHFDVHKKYYLSAGIPHYAIDIVSPKTDYSVAKFKRYADQVIVDILWRGKVPIIAGGTGFWIKAIVDDISYPEVAPDPVLRSMLRNKPTEELFTMIEKLDPERAQNIDAKNPVRLIRAIEICQTLGKVPKIEKGSSTPPMGVELPHQFLQIGIAREKEELHKRIKLNVKNRFANGMIDEVQKLHQDGLSWKKMTSFGLSYKLIPEYLKEKNASEEELIEKIYLAEKDYAKRQLTWFKKDKRIVWLEEYPEIEKKVKYFLKK